MAMELPGVCDVLGRVRHHSLQRRAHAKNVLHCMICWAWTCTERLCCSAWALLKASTSVTCHPMKLHHITLSYNASQCIRLHYTTSDYLVVLALDSEATSLKMWAKTASMQRQIRVLRGYRMGYGSCRAIGWDTGLAGLPEWRGWTELG